MFLLFGWFKLVGFGIFQYRAFGYLLWSAGVALLCLAVRRARLIAARWRWRSWPACCLRVMPWFLTTVPAGMTR